MNYLKKELYELIKTDESIFDYIQSTALDGLWYWNTAQPDHIWINPKFWATLGYTPEEMSEELPNEKEIILHLAVEEAFQYFLKEVQDTPTPVEKVMSFVHKAGQQVWIKSKALLIRNQQGEASRLLCTHYDITDRQNAEKQVLIEREELESFFSLNLDLLCIADFEGKFIKVNKAWEEVLGYSQEELEGRKFLDFVHSDDLPATLTEIQRLSEGEKTINFENRYRCLDGSYRCIEWRAVPKNNRIYAAARDVSPRKKIEIALIEKKQEIEAITKALDESAIVSITDTKGIITKVNQNFIEISQYTEAELLGYSHNIISSAYHSPEFWKTLWKTISSGNTWRGEIRNRAKDGAFYWVDTVINPIYDAENKISQFLSIRNLITDKKKSETEILKVTSLLNDAQKIANLGGWELDLSTGKTFWTDEVYTIHEVEKGFDHNKSNGIEFYHPDYQQIITDAITHTIQRHEPFDVTCRFITAKGNHRWVRASGKAVVERGDALRLIGTFQDITEQKEIQSQINTQKELLDSIITGLQEGFALVDADGVHLKVNPALCQMTGFSEEELIGISPPFPYWAESHVEEIEMLFKKTMASQLNDENIETMFKRKDGTFFPAIIKPNIIKDQEDKLCYTFATVQDISKQKQYEANLLRAKHNAEAANHAKSDFLANMSHEIRTPLNGVIGFTDLLMKTPLEEYQQEYMQTVYQSANLLLDLINDILDFSKIEAGKLDLNIEKTDLLALSDQITNIIKYQAQKKSLEVILHISPNTPRYVWIDSVRIKQVLVNLLGNAVKFTKNGEIELQIEVLEEISSSQTKLRFSIKDTGIGIAPEKQQVIFEAFSQEDNTTSRRFGGTGLGLSISNRLLALMGSQLQLESVQGQGSSFYFEIILSTEKGEKQDWTELNQLGKILLVDDNKNNQKIIEEMLSDFDIELLVAENGLEVLSKLEKGERFEVILLDYYMPFMNGIEVAQKIRNTLKIPANEQAIMLLHSANNDEALQKSCEEFSIKLQISKPIRFEQLAKALWTLIHPESNLEPITEQNQQTHQAADIPAHVSILIVDDNRINMLLAKTLVRHQLPSATIFEAYHGQEALNIFKQERPSLILMDIQMPEMNGYEATKAIRALPQGKEVIIIALTAGTVKGEQEKCIAAGMNDYLSKPVVSENLEKVIQQWLEKPQKIIITENTTDVILQFDAETLQKRIYHDEELFQIILKESLSYLQGVVPELKQKIKLEDFEEIKKSAHRLKGTALSACFMKLAVLADKIEMMEDYDKLRVEQISQKIAEEIEMLQGLLQTYLHS